MQVDVALLPHNLDCESFKNKTCIVLDIFRATTSIVTAIANGCEKILPVISLECANAVGKNFKQPLFAGERKSLKIAGFNFGNSPLEFTKQAVQGQTIIMTTSNGTIAIEATKTASRTLIGAFINVDAVCQQALEYQQDIIIVCAGTDRQFSLEDALGAGAMVERLSTVCEASDAALGVALMYKAAKEDLSTIVANSKNGKRLVELQYLEDLRYCLQENILSTVPIYKNGKIVAI